MNSRPPELSKRRLADLVGIIQVPSLREVFEGLKRAMHELPLTPYDLADFLRLVGFDELCKVEVAEVMLPVFIAQLQGYLSKSEDELLEGLRWLRAQEWVPKPVSTFGKVHPALDASSPLRFSAFGVLSFHDPPGCNLREFLNVSRIGLMRAIDAARWD